MSVTSYGAEISTRQSLDPCTVQATGNTPNSRRGMASWIFVSWEHSLTRLPPRSGVHFKRTPDRSGKTWTARRRQFRSTSRRPRFGVRTSESSTPMVSATRGTSTLGYGRPAAPTSTVTCPDRHSTVCTSILRSSATSTPAKSRSETALARLTTTSEIIVAAQTRTRRVERAPC